MDSSETTAGSSVMTYLHREDNFHGITPLNVRDDEFRYSDVPVESQAFVKELLRGKIQPADITPQEPCSVKLYFCAGSDMEVERTIAREEVAPLLHEYSRRHYGMDTQIVDVRCGMPDQLLDDPWTRDVCLNELKACLETSVGPSLAIVLGMKYGRPVLPSKIASELFTIIRSCLKKSRSDVSLLDTWYLRDSNASPPVYLLQRNVPRDDGSTESWREHSGVLIQLLEQGSSMAISLGKLSAEDVSDITDSLLGSEVSRGLRCEKVSGRCLAFLRFLTDKNKDMTCPEARDYVDRDETTGQLDSVAFQRISQLCGETVPEALDGSSNIKTVNVSWKTVAESWHDHSPDGYSTFFSRYLFSKCKELIDESVLQREADGYHLVVRDVMNSWLTAGEVTKGTQFRDLSHVIQGYLASLETDQPLILYGPAGIGKTVIAAQIARFTQSFATIVYPELQSVVVVRFCDSSQCPTLESLLLSLCQQLCFVMGKCQPQVPASCENLKSLFFSLIQKAEFSGMLVIILDAVDMIHCGDAAHLFEWIPARIGSNVKLIMTVRQESVEILKTLSRKFEVDNFIKIELLAPEACEDILKSWMKRAGRTLTATQWGHLRSATQHCDTPVFLQLLLQQALSWASFDRVQPTDVPHSTTEAIHSYLARLESKHGALLCSKVFGYMTVAQESLTQQELVDFLSMDENILNQVSAKYNLEKNVFPVCYLHHLLQDSGNLLKQTAENGSQLVTWRNRVLLETARERYTMNTAVKHKLYSVMSDYFLYRWCGRRRQPSRCESFDGSAVVNGTDVPRLSSQSITMSSETGRQLNHRISKFLPRCLAGAERTEVLKSEVLCQFEWIRAKLLLTVFNELCVDYGCTHDREALLVLDALKSARKALEVDINVLGVELSGRLLPFAPKYKHIQRLITQCDLHAQRFNPCIPNCQLYSTVGGPLVSESVLDTKLVYLFQNSDGLIMAAQDDKHRCYNLWNLSLAREVRDVKFPIGQLYATPCGRNICVIGKDMTLRVYQVDSGELQWTTQLEREVSQLVASNRFVGLTVKKGTGPILLDTGTGEVVHRLWHQSRTLAISSNDEYMVCSSDRQLYLYTLPLLERKMVIDTDDIWQKIKFFNTSLKFLTLSISGRLSLFSFDPVFSSSSCSLLVRDFDILDFVFNQTESMSLVRCSHCIHICDTNVGSVVHSLKNLPEGVYMDKSSTFTGAAFTPDSKIVVASRFSYLCAWSVTTGQPLRIIMSAASPIDRLYYSNDLTLAVSLQANGLMQVWDFKGLDETVKLVNTVTDSAVHLVRIALQAGVILCVGSGCDEANLISIDTGEVRATLQHVEGSEIDEACLSQDGMYAVTISLQRHGPYTLDFEDEKAIQISRPEKLREAILWNLKSGRKMYHVVNVIYFSFNPDSTVIAFLTSVSTGSIKNPNVNTFAVVTLDVASGEEKYTEILSKVDFVSEPFLIAYKTSQNKICTLFVSVVMTFNGGSKLKSESPDVLAISLTGVEEPAVTFFRIQDLFRAADINAQIVNAIHVGQGRVLFFCSSGHDDQMDVGGSTFSPASNYSAFMYDFETSVVIRHFPRILPRNSDLSLVKFSQDYSVLMGSGLEVVSLKNGEKINSFASLDIQNAQFALDGRYICALTRTRNEVIVIRSSDGMIKGRLFVHGTGTDLCVGEDGRTVAVGCDDGRVLIFSLILELSDPLKELVNHLPSRQYKPVQNDVLQKDIQRLSGSATKLRRLSAKMDSARLSKRQRPPSYKLLETSVHVTRNYNRQRGSQACSLQ